MAEIFFWKNNIEALNVKCISEYKVPQVLFCSDASAVACGGVITSTDQVRHCMWDEQQSKQSSTWGELKANHFSLVSFKKLFFDKVVICRSDSPSCSANY